MSAKKRLTRAERKQIEAAIARANRTDKKEKSAQDSIPYKRMMPDGICVVTDTYFTKTIQFQDINYQLSQNEDKTAIFEAWCDFLNYFDASVKFQLTFANLSVSKEVFTQSISIPPKGDEFDSIREEYAQMLQRQLERGNNGLVKTKYLTFGIEAQTYRMAKMRLERLEIDILNNFKRLGVKAEVLNGKERLQVLHDILRMDEQEQFLFNWDWLAPSGLSTKDFIAPSSFEYKNGKGFRMGKLSGAVSFLQILAPELNDRILAEFLNLESSIIVNLHVQSVDQVSAIKTIKRKITDLDRAKIEEQKKAVRSGYDMDIIPSDLATYGAEAKKLLQDLQSRNERMFLLTFLVMNTSENPRQLNNNIFQVKSIAQKHNCSLVRLDYQQEEGVMSSLPLGKNYIDIQRGLTSSCVAIFIPFTTQELFQTGKEALYYGINALSNNLIMVDRKLLKNPNGLILGTPGCCTGDTQILFANGTPVSFAELVDSGIQQALIKAYDEEKQAIVTAPAKDIRIEKYVDELIEIELLDGSMVKCTPEHLILTRSGEYMQAKEMRPGQLLSGGHMVVHVTRHKLMDSVPVYDMSVPKHLNFVLANGLVVHNSGKSFSAKREISNAFLVTNDDILICDPESEYAPLVERLGGQVIRISPTSPDHINPIDINLNYSDDDNPLSLKSDFILSLCELIVAGKDGLAPVEKTIIDRCVRLVYQDYLNDPKPENMPILGDLYDTLRKQAEKEAQYIATALEIYVSGSLSVFNHQTNVDIKNRIVCFDIRELGKQLKKIGMLIVQDQVWNRVTENRFFHLSAEAQKLGQETELVTPYIESSEPKATRYYIDEFHLLLKEEQTAAYSVEIWKRFRKWGGIPTGITQNVKDLLSSREIENIFENSDFIYMLNQAAGDRQILAKHLGISPHQLSYVTHSGEGEGLLFYGNTILPFIDHFPKETELYKVMTTKFAENVQEAS